MGQKKSKDETEPQMKIKENGDVEWPTGRKMSPQLEILLEKAVQTKDWEEVETYLMSEFEESGFDDDDDDITLLDMASVLGYSDVVNAWIENAHGKDDLTRALCWASFKGRINQVISLIKRGASVKDVDQNEWPLLHVAVHQQRVDIAKVLISNGADVNSSHDEYEPPLYIACGNNMVEMLNMLLQNGADFKQVNDDGRSPFHRAARYVVFERENFNNFSFSRSYYVTQITRISLESLTHTARKSVLECGLDCDVHSNTGTDSYMVC